MNEQYQMCDLNKHFLGEKKGLIKHQQQQQQKPTLHTHTHTQTDIMSFDDGELLLFTILSSTNHLFRV